MLAVLFGMLYKREVWCRHLCPLGRLATSLAPASPLPVHRQTERLRIHRARPTSCYKGTPEISGCPVFHHPLEGKQAYRCKLCFECLKACPHNSANLQIRPPLAATWRLDAGAKDLAMFASL